MGSRGGPSWSSASRRTRSPTSSSRRSRPTMAPLGARDVQHAFDRALLQGRIESARWLHAHGATLAPGIIMGSCETLNADGFDFLADLGAPLTDEHGDRRAPLAL